MNKRNANARTAQNGACNPRPISAALNEAISECYTEGVSPADDPAVFLILHQLAWILTGHDITVGIANHRLGRRWDSATATLETELKED